MTIRNALKMLKPYYNRMTIVMVLAIIVSAISAISPYVSRNMIDNGLLQGNIRVVAHLILILIVLQISGQIAEYLQRRQEINITNALSIKMKTEAFEHGLRLKPHYFKEQGFYKTISDTLYDITNILQITNNSLLTILVILCKCVGAMVGLIILDWRLSIFVAAIIPIKVWLSAVIRRYAERHGKQLMDDNKDYNSWLTNILSGIIDIKLWNLEKKTLAEYADHVQKINESSKKLSLLRSKNNLVTVLMEYTLINAMYILGALLISNERLTFGGLMAFITFASYVLSPVNIIMELRVIFKQIAPNAEGLKCFYSLEEEAYGATLPIKDNIATIEFRNVSLSFDGRTILNNLSLTINRGEKVAIIGDNGSGKTSIINLLLRLCEPTEGEILIDGISITKYSVEDYRRLFSVVSQDIHLFQGTVKENILLANESNITKYDDRLLKFCTEVVESWDKQYDTEVGSEGTKLSGGERQKIALLRALHRKARILVLDEPTSSYDKESEEEFNRFIKENTEFDFYFLVTHRKEFLSFMDKVVELDG